MNLTFVLLASFAIVAPERKATVVLPEYPETSSLLAATEPTNYVSKATVSVRRMHPLRPGETWRIMFGRNRTITDEICPNHWDRNFTVGGCGYHDISNFTPVKIVE